MKIVFAVTVPFTANAFLIPQIQHLITRGHDVHLLTAPEPGFDALTQIPGLSVHKVAMQRDPAGWKDFNSLVAFIRVLRKIEADLIVYSTPKAGLLGALAGWFTRIPIRVYHLRGLRLEGLTGMQKVIAALAENTSAALAESIVCDSPSLSSAANQLYFMTPTKRVVLGNGSACGVDTSKFRPNQNEFANQMRKRLKLENTLTVGFIGRIHKDKGVVDLISACSLLREEVENLALLLVGPIEDEALDSIIRGQKYEWIRYCDAVSDTSQYFNLLHIFCLPSVREGFPIATLEASASEIPVITSDATGCVDSVVPGVTGLCVPKNDIPALTDALRLLANDEKMRRRMGRAARRWAVENYAESTVTNVWTKFIEGRFARRRSVSH